MSRSQINLQDAFLNHVRKEKIPVVIHIAGGGKIEGLVKGFDNFVILVKHDGQHLIYKHAINSIVPERAVELSVHNTHMNGETAVAAEAAPAATGASCLAAKLDASAACTAGDPHPAVVEAITGTDTSAPETGITEDNGEPWVEA